MDITGQLFLRDVNQKMRGKKLVAVCGIISVPEDTEIEGEHQLLCTGTVFIDSYSITLSRLCKINRTSEAEGEDIGHLLTQPIWKV
jgi:hypothetical protein